MRFVESPRTALIVLFLVLALGAWLRLDGISQREFNLDEAFSFRFAEEASFGEIVSPFSAQNRQDRHPTLHYLMAWSWMRTGYPAFLALGTQPETAFRLPAVALSMASIVLIFLCGRRLGGPALGLMAAFLLAIGGYSIDIAREMRMYPLLELTGLWTLFEALRILHRSSPSSIDWARLIAAAFLLSLSHYAGLIFAAAAWGYLLLARPRTWKALFASGLVLTVAYSYWLAGMWTQLQSEAVEGGPRLSSGLVVPYTYAVYFFSEFLVPLRSRADLPAAWWALALSGFALAVAAWGFLRASASRHADRLLILWMGALVPATMWLGSFWVPKLFLNARYAVAVEGVFILAFAAGLLGWWGPSKASRPSTGTQASLGLMAAGIFLALNSIALGNMNKGEGRPYIPWKEAVAQIDAAGAEVALVYSPHMTVPLDLYGLRTPSQGLPLDGVESWERLLGMTPGLKGTSGHRVLLVIAHPHQAEMTYRTLFDQRGRTLGVKIVSSAPSGPWASPFEQAELRLMRLQ